MQARLKVLHDKANVKQVKLLPVTVIGRSTECNLKIASSQVSRNHCRITVSGDAVYVEDLGSANGTLVDGQLLTPHQPTAIAPGAHIVVGPAEFQIDYVAPTSATVVLQRAETPPVADLPATEVISSLVPLPVAAAVAQVVAPVAAVVAAPAPVAVAVPVAPPVVAVEMPAPVVAAVAVAEVPQVQQEVAPAPVLDTSRDTTLLEPGFNFGNAEPEQAESAGSPEDTVFMFQEQVPESVPYGDAPPAEPVTKKAGLKSLFSMFGRKEKPAQAAPPAEEAPAAAAPSVFLPTVEPVEDTSAAETIEIEGEQAADTSTEDDGFGQFLSQF